MIFVVGLVIVQVCLYGHGSRELLGPAERCMRKTIIVLDLIYVADAYLGVQWLLPI